MRAYGLVSSDVSEDTSADITAVEAMARKWRLDMGRVDVKSAGALSSTVALLQDSGFDIVVVPSERHVHDFMAALRRSVAVWAADRQMCWPHSGGRPRRITRPGRHLDRM
ncbi:hypothetical protein AB0G00_33845 [Nocardia salmonicida]|uniref:hypothetical protein n=1 Tax=Nocardia salmonicida TaxID=53431 RepID=UPI002E2805E0|nr:hypothetical protein [Nocardia salmonicida]